MTVAATPRPAISSLLTLIVTTSPTPSAPSTDLLSAVLRSFEQHCPTLLACRVIVTIDTFDRVADQPMLKRGQASPEIAASFGPYKSNVKALFLQQYGHPADVALEEERGGAEFGSPTVPQNRVNFMISRTADKQVTFIEPTERLGFGLAVRSALRIADTPYVWVHQHDWALMMDIPLKPLLDVMQDWDESKSAPIKYVCFPSIRNVSYRVVTLSAGYPALCKVVHSLPGAFSPASDPETSIPLTPLFFWHDKPHVASTAHYLDRVFPSPLAIARGAFIEDHIGQRARNQMKEGHWHRWASWLYYPQDGKQLCLRHLLGRTWKGEEYETKQKAKWAALKKS